MIVVFIVIIIIAIASSIIHDRGDYNDGGGTQIGGSERIPLLLQQTIELVCMEKSSLTII